MFELYRIIPGYSDQISKVLESIDLSDYQSIDGSARDDDNIWVQNISLFERFMTLDEESFNNEIELELPPELSNFEFCGDSLSFIVLKYILTEDDMKNYVLKNYVETIPTRSVYIFNTEKCKYKNVTNLTVFV